MRRVDLIGQTFGQWTVDAKDPSPTAANRATYWLVTCTCGTERSIRSENLLSGRSWRCRSCMMKERHAKTQKCSVSPL